jgi:aldose 1-epimerase
VEIYTLRNPDGMTARIMTYGGIVQSLSVPDRQGNFSDVVLGYDSLGGYLTNSPYFGALIGRYGNRIAKGHFTLDGKTYTLALNNGSNSLHGGLKGFDKVVWQVVRAEYTPQGPQLELTYTSPDGEEGYPGTLTVTALYTVTRNNELRVDFTATTDEDTIVNLTQHSYFNLSGHGNVLSNVVYLNADEFTPVDSTLVPTGEVRPVANTPFDFRTPATIGSRVNADDEQIKFGGGIDHNWVMNHPPGKLGLDARVTDPASGRVLEVWSTEPGMQFYSGNFLDGTITGKDGVVYPHRGAFAMEPQHFPDSPNHPNFPSVVLKPGEVYQNTIIYKFLTQ